MVKIHTLFAEGQNAFATLTPAELNELAFISDWKTMDPDSPAPSKHGYQRELFKDRLPKIARYYRTNNNRRLIPPILISVEEEHRMANRGFRVEGKPEQRYAGIRFSGFSLRSDWTLPRERGVEEENNRQQGNVPSCSALDAGPGVIEVHSMQQNGEGLS